MPQHPGHDATMATIDSMLAGAGPAGAPMPGATPMPSSEGAGLDIVVAQLAAENAQLRALVGLGPNDPIPDPTGVAAPPAAAGGAGIPPV